MTKDIHLHSTIICFVWVQKKQRNSASIFEIERLPTIGTVQHEKKKKLGDIDYVQQNEPKTNRNLLYNQVK